MEDYAESCVTGIEQHVPDVSGWPLQLHSGSVVMMWLNLLIVCTCGGVYMLITSQCRARH